MCSVVRVNWARILQSFSLAFESTFTTNKKAHFDCVPINLRVVDGAKSRWCNLILIDAVIFLLELREFNEGSRRSFDQQQVLLECIVSDIKLVSPLAYQSYIDGNGKVLAELNIQVADIESPWDTVDDLKRVLLSDPTSKSREKFVKIVESLFSHSAFQCNPFSLQTVFSLAATHAFTAYPAHMSSLVSKKRASGKQIPSRVLLPKTILPRPVFKEEVIPSSECAPREMSPAVGMLQSSDGFDASIFDDLMEAECDMNDRQPWDYLDEWDTADAPLPSRAMPSITGRPLHPPPISGAGNLVREGSCFFRSITHDCEKPILTTEEAMRTESACSSLFYGHDQLQSVLRPSVATGQHVMILPFPESIQSVYSRRTSFSVQSFSVLSLHDAPQVTMECATCSTPAPCDLHADVDMVRSLVNGAEVQGCKRVRAVTFDSTIPDPAPLPFPPSVDALVAPASALMNVVSTYTTPIQHLCAGSDSHSHSHTAVAAAKAAAANLMVTSITTKPSFPLLLAPSQWDNAELDFDLALDFALDFAAEEGPVFALEPSYDALVKAQDSFFHTEAAPLAPSMAVLRPTPKRPATAMLESRLEESLPAKKRMI